MTSSGRAIVRVEVDREIAEDAQRYFTDLESELPRHFEDEQAVNPHLVRRHGKRVGDALLPANVEGVEAIAGAAVVVEDGGDLEIKVVREIQLRADLPGKHPGVGVRHEAATLHGSRPERVLRIRIVVFELPEVDEEIELYFEGLGLDRGRGVLAVFAIGLNRRALGAAAEVQVEGMLPL